MTAVKEMKEIVEEAFDTLEQNIEDLGEGESKIESYTDLGGYLTNDKGLEVILTNGKKFIITIKEVN